MAQPDINKLILRSEFSELEKIEPFITGLFTNITGALLNNIKLAVNEAASNALIHGNKQDSAKKIIITAKRHKKKVEVTVKDEGKGFDPADLPDPTAKRQLLNKDGRGVFLIKKYADEVTFEQQGTLVRMIFYPS